MAFKTSSSNVQKGTSEDIWKKKPKKMIGSRGKSLAEFDSPFGIVVDEKREVFYVSDQGNFRIQVLDFEGDGLTSFGTAGKANGQLNEPRGLTLHPTTGHVLVADSQNHRVQAFDDRGQFLMCIGEGEGKGGSLVADQIAGRLQTPSGVICNSKGDIVVTDTGYHCGQIFDYGASAGPRFMRIFGHSNDQSTHFAAPTDACLDHWNRLVIADQKLNRIGIWSADGSQHIKNIPLRVAPWSVCVSSNFSVLRLQHHQFMVSTMNHNILVFDVRNNKLLQTLGLKGATAGFFSSPTCVRNFQDDLIVVDRDNARLQFFQNP